VTINGVLDSSISSVPVNTSPVIISNMFEVPAGSTGVLEGINAGGSYASGVVGGAGTLANTFENFPAHLAIFMTDTGDYPPVNFGLPATQIENNNYVNSPDPVTVNS
jgi:hypothetical protein